MSTRPNTAPQCVAVEEDGQWPAVRPVLNLPRFIEKHVSVLTAESVAQRMQGGEVPDENEVVNVLIDVIDS